jgi:SAM-dependent methyltransferase
MRRTAPPGDFWRPYAQGFRADPSRANDPLINRLILEIEPNQSLLDVGAGGGRVALPLARQCLRVTAVEPSESMGSLLLQQAKAHNITNVTLIQSSWEDAIVEPEDIVLCVHVVYTIREIEPFVRKLESHARVRVLVVLYNAAPQSQIYPLWQLVHGEERRPLPALPEFEAVLAELNIVPEIEMLPPQTPRGFNTIDDAHQQLAQRLYLTPGSPQENRLREVLPEILVPWDSVYQIRGASPLRLALLRW